MSETVALNREQFEAFIGKTFRFSRPEGADEINQAPEEAVELRLETIDELPEYKPPGASEPLKRSPFSLMFRGPDQPILPQSIYQMTDPGNGDIPVEQIFIAPLGPDAGDEGGVLYEAVFN